MSDPQWAAVIVAAIAAVLSFVVSGIALRVSIRGQRESREQADRATRAAERSAAAAEESAAVAREEAERYEPPWRLEHVVKDRFLLINGGEEPAHDVVLDMGANIVRGKTRHEVIGGGRHLDLIVVQRRALTVSWRRPDETKRRSWTSAFPA